jgi:hypothetical protein
MYHIRLDGLTMTLTGMRIGRRNSTMMGEGFKEERKDNKGPESRLNVETNHTPSI